MKEKLSVWYKRIRVTTEFKVFTELLFWGIVITLWTTVGNLMSAYNDLVVYAGYLLGAILVTVSALRLYNYFLSIKTNTTK